jgi:hypothetical protein
MGYAYAAKELPEVDDGSSDDWPDNWPWPPTWIDGDEDPTWPPGWPKDISASVFVNAPPKVAPASGVQIITTVSSLDADLNGHVVQVTATLGGATVRLKRSGDGSFRSRVYSTISGSTATDIYVFDLLPEDVGKTLVVTSTLISVQDRPYGFDSLEVAYDYSCEIDIPESISRPSSILVSSSWYNGEDLTDDLDGYVIRYSATIDGATLQLNDTGSDDTFANYVDYELSGSSNLRSLYFKLTPADHGKEIEVFAEIDFDGELISGSAISTAKMNYTIQVNLPDGITRPISNAVEITVLLDGEETENLHDKDVTITATRDGTDLNINDTGSDSTFAGSVDGTISGSYELIVMYAELKPSHHGQTIEVKAVINYAGEDIEGIGESTAKMNYTINVVPPSNATRPAKHNTIYQVLLDGVVVEHLNGKTLTTRAKIGLTTINLNKTGSDSSFGASTTGVISGSSLNLDLYFALALADHGLTMYLSASITYAGETIAGEYGMYVLMNYTIAVTAPATSTRPNGHVTTFEVRLDGFATTLLNGKGITLSADIGGTEVKINTTGSDTTFYSNRTANISGSSVSVNLYLQLLIPQHSETINYNATLSYGSGTISGSGSSSIVMNYTSHVSVVESSLDPGAGILVMMSTKLNGLTITNPISGSVKFYSELDGYPINSTTSSNYDYTTTGSAYQTATMSSASASKTVYPLVFRRDDGKTAIFYCTATFYGSTITSNEVSIPIDDVTYLASMADMFLVSGPQDFFFLDQNGGVKWKGIDGYYAYGQSDIPSDLSSGVSLLKGSNITPMALKGDRLYIWGNDNVGQISGMPAECQTGVSDFSNDGNHCLALKNGRVYAWGYNPYGETVVPASCLSGVTSVCAGRYISVAVKGGGCIQWGLVTGTSKYPPVPAAAQSGVLFCRAGFLNGSGIIIAFKSNGSLVAWSPLDATTPPTSYPPPPGGSGYEDFAINGNGLIAAWASGNLYLGGYDETALKTWLNSLSNISHIYFWFANTFVIHTDGSFSARSDSIYYSSNPLGFFQDARYL